MQVYLDTASIESYDRFLAIKSLPAYRINGRIAEFPDEYSDRVGLRKPKSNRQQIETSQFAFDYQAAVAAMAIRKQKFCVFAECGLGKTLMMLDYIRHVIRSEFGKVLIVSPLMVIRQTMEECKRFYSEFDLTMEQVRAADLQDWLNGSGGQVGITNYEAIRQDLRAGKLRALVLDESSMLKSHYGKWGTKLLEMGRGLKWKLALTGTPAPNDRIEYANHAVFMDQFPTVNSFLATYFVNRGQTDNRWELKPHALRPFYRSLSHWCIFLTDPAVFGWKDNTDAIPPIRTHVHHVPMTDEQIQLAYHDEGRLFAAEVGGITNRSVLSGIAKGFHKGMDVATNKPQFIHDLVRTWPDESTIVWCKYNREQELLESILPDAVSVKGATPDNERQAAVDDFKSGRVRVLITKPKILGFGLNLQVATRQVFSGLQDSYEEFHQAVKRSNRVGSTRPLNVHIPITDIEEPMIDSVLRKRDRVVQDTEEQQEIFRQCMTL